MRPKKVRFFARATILALLWSFTIATAAEVGVCAIVDKPASFNHQTVTLQGIVTALKETTSRRGNDYTTFKLQDPSGCGAVSIFAWGHPTVNNGDRVHVDGVFETEHHQGHYTFYNEIEATKVTAAPH
jgi:RecJ-like exonuclease